MARESRFVGRHLKRVEDPRLIQGQASYVDDLVLPGMVHGYVLRSPHAHARVLSLDISPASAFPGVVLVLTGKDVESLGQKPLGVVPQGLRVPRHPALAVDKVRYVGQPVAAVFATTRYAARDATGLIQADYEPLDPVTDPERALQSGAARVHEELPDNLLFEASWKRGPVDEAFAAADRVIRGRFVHQRMAAISIEPRGIVVHPQADSITCWISTQMPHRTRAMFAPIFGIGEHKVRVIAPEVGGSFGSKTGLYDDEIAVIFGALRLRRPVKWIETRSESLVATKQGRGQLHEAELAVNRDGTFLALRVRCVADLGAYPEYFSAGPPGLAGRLMTGAYRIQAGEYATKAVATNKTPTGPYRGAGRPEAAYMIERLADLAAVELGIDPVEIRKKNFIRPEEFPYVAASGLTFDCGRYELGFDLALKIADYEQLRVEQAKLRKEGRYLGIGLSAFVETAGAGPSKKAPTPGWEYASVRAEQTGRVTVLTGTSPHGQGQETTFAQIVADELGVGPSDVTVLHGDTAVVPLGLGTGGARGTGVGGSAVYLAAQSLKEKAKKVAAHILEAAPDDVIFDSGKLFVRGAPDKTMTFQQIAAEAHRGVKLPPGMDAGLEASHVFDPDDFTVPFGVYIAVVEVLPETGEVEVRRFVGVDDVGNVLSPTLLEGQLHGGIAQGIAQALWEEVVYDKEGQLLTGSLMDYAVPKADQFPEFELDRTVTPTPLNPLGAKGVGETGAVGAPAAIVNAVMDALSPFGIRNLDMPLTPEKIWRAIQEVKRQ